MEFVIGLEPLVAVLFRQYQIRRMESRQSLVDEIRFRHQSLQSTYFELGDDPLEVVVELRDRLEVLEAQMGPLVDSEWPEDCPLVVEPRLQAFPNHRGVILREVMVLKLEG